MKEEKTPKNLIHPSIDNYLLLKNQGEHDNGQAKMLKIYFTGEHDKGGNMAKGITVYIFLLLKKNYKINNFI